RGRFRSPGQAFAGRTCSAGFQADERPFALSMRFCSPNCSTACAGGWEATMRKGVFAAAVNGIMPYDEPGRRQAWGLILKSSLYYTPFESHSRFDANQYAAYLILHIRETFHGQAAAGGRKS